MKPMKALCTAEASPEIRVLEKHLQIHYAGWATEQRILSEDDMAALMAAHGPEILLTSYDPITRKVIDSSPGLKLVVCTRANPVNVDDGYLREKGIPLSYAPERNSDSAAEYTVAMMLAVMRRIPNAHHDLKMGLHTGEESPVVQSPKEGLRRDVTWALGKDTPYVHYKGFHMKGRTLGIVGYGSIGRRVADICRAFGMKIMVYDPYLPEALKDDAVFASTLLELAREADVLTVHSKDTPETFHIINQEVLTQMKPDAFFINTSRGALVDEEALVEALRSNTIGGAALDVFDSEPIAKNHPLLKECHNVVLTPHLAGATHDAIHIHTHQLVTDVTHFLRGEALEYAY